MGLKIGIIGGGVMGLALAYRLSKIGCQVQIFEAGNQIGGLSTWFDYGDFVWDKYYHVILKQDRELLQLLEELGLYGKLHWQRTLTGFLWNKRLISMSNYWEFLRFPALSFFEKMRLGSGILRSRYFQKPEQLEGMTAKNWLISVFGKKVFFTIWEPLLESKFGVLKDRIPAFLLWATINRYYGTRSKTDGKEWMGYLSGGGLRVMLQALEEKILGLRGSIRLRERVSEIIDRGPHELEIRTNQRAYSFDRVICTAPSTILKQIYPDFKRENCCSPHPEFLGVIRLALVLDRSLSPYYVTNLIDKNHPFTGIVELSRVVDPLEFKGKSLVMLPRYDLPCSEWFKMTDEEIKKKFLSTIKMTWPSIEQNVCSSFVAKEKIVQAIWMRGAPGKEPWISENRLLWMVNAELSGNENLLNNNAIVGIANRAAEKFIAMENLR